MNGSGFRLIVVVGLQKSGTSLLHRMLQDSGLAGSPFRGEGLDFWGDVPPFSPERSPTGTIYQQSGGADGHEASADDATEEDKAELRSRLAELSPGTRFVVNKNPYNTVRVPWVRAVFPESVIVAVVRHPVANVYSLLKKYEPHEQRGEPPHDGWWGVKPKGWRDMVDDDKLVQCARQWRAVNEKLWQDRSYLDKIVTYHDLCANPGEVVGEILGTREHAADFGEIRCFDGEYARGSRLRSKNRYYRETGGFETPRSEEIEFPPLHEHDVTRIEDTCRSVAERLGLDG